MALRPSLLGLIASAGLAFMAAGPVVAPVQAAPPGGEPAPAPGSVKIKVLDSNNAPVAGARVELVRRHGPARVGTTNASGEVTFAEVRVGPIGIRAGKQGVGRARAEGRVQSGQELSKSLTLRLPPAGGGGGN